MLFMSVAAVFTVIGVVYALTRPGRAFSSLEKTLECNVEVHTHTADCYDADGNLICGYADYILHVHDEELCYDENGELVCTLPEIIPHEHDDNCYMERLVLICGAEEGQVMDPDGKPVFDSEGNPVFSIEDVPVIETITVEGETTEGTAEEAADGSAEDTAAGTTDGESEASESGAQDGKTETDTETAEKDASNEADTTAETDATKTDADNGADATTDGEAGKTGTDADKTDTNAGNDVTAENGATKIDADNGADATTDAGADKADADVASDAGQDKTNADAAAGSDKTESDVNTETTENGAADENADATSGTGSDAGTENAAAETRTAEEESTEGQATEAQATETQSTEAESTEAQATETQSTEAESTEAQATEAQSTEVESTEAQATEAQSTEAESTEAQATEAQSTEVQASETTEVPSEDEIISETVSFGANADNGDDESVYTYHVHTAECYKIEKELICTIPTVHIHSAECYDENGALTCGKLQLAMHVHGEECFCYEEKTVTKTAVAGDYTITATYGASAKIPSKAELRAQIISEGTDVYTENESAIKEKMGEDAKPQVMFDIGFFVNGEEIEPQGPVNITFTLNSEDYNSGDDLTVIHTHDDGNMDVDVVPIDEAGNAVITTESFSIYTLLANDTEFEFNRKYGSYYLGLIEGNDAFRNSPEFEAHRSYTNELGIAANFHVVAFNTYQALSTHVNGNFAAKRLIAAPSNFGTNGLTNEISYFQTVDDFSQLTQNPGTTADGCAVVFGYGVIPEAVDNGNHIAINGLQINSPYNIYIEKSEADRFIDFDKLKKEIVALRDSLAQNDDINTVYHYSNEDNGSYIKLTEIDTAGYITLDAQDFQDHTKGRNLKLDGFSHDHDGTLIINLDCSNIPKGGTFTFPKSAVMVADGVDVETGEVVTFENGKVVWNFFNCEGITIESVGPMHGLILAPEARVTSSSSLQGQIIANDVYITGESHRSSFSGTLIPFKAMFTGLKTVDNAIPAEDQVFDFTLSEYKDGTWTEVETVKNNGQNIAFTKLLFMNEKQKGVHWYRINEVAGSGDTGDISYVYDPTVYYVKVDLGFENNKYKVDFEYYRYPEGQQILTTDVGIVPEASFTIDSTDLRFDNRSNNTEISVSKEWTDYKNEALTEGIPESLTVYLYSTMDSSADLSFDPGTAPEGVSLLESVSLTAEGNWSHTWSKLPAKDKATGKQIYYFVKEENLAGFTGSESRSVWFTEGEQHFVNRKPYEYTKLEVEKKFVAYTLSGEEVFLSNPRPDGKNASNDYVTFKLVRDVYAGDALIREKEEYNGKAELNRTEMDITDGLFKIKGSDDWKCLVEKLPSVEYIDDVLYRYEYSIVETSDSSLGYAFMESTVEEFEENGKTYRRFVVKNGLKPAGFDVYKKWFTYTGTQDSIQTSKDSDVSIMLSLVVNNEENTTHIAKGCYILYATSVDDSGAAYPVELIDDASSETGKTLWAFRVTNVPGYYAEEREDGSIVLKKYSYSLNENPVEGYEFVAEDVTLSSGESITGSITLSIPDENGQYGTIVIKNMSEATFMLPETGGSGRFIVYIAGGLIAVLSAAALLLYRKKLRRN